jgi:putative redox protein
MIEITARYDGKTKCLLTHPEGMILTTDTPRELGGDASAFSPTDLIASGLATCILTTIALWGERHQLELTGMSATVEKEMRVKPSRIGRLAVTITVPSAAVPEEQRARLEAIGYRCPVHASLHPEIEAPILYRYV